MVHDSNRLIYCLRRFDPYLLLLLGLSLLALTPLSAPGYFYEAHDGRHSVFYQIMFDASLRDGAWWPRWAMHHIQGYGYPTFIIQAPLGFYLAEIFVLLGAGYTLAAKLTWTTGFLAGAWGMYRLVGGWLVGDDLPLPEGSATVRRLAALVAALLYVFIPYHLVDIYVRAALNDTLLLGWFPWVLLAFDRLIQQGGAVGWPRRLAWAILTLGGTLLTHTFALISFAPLLVTFVFFRLGSQVTRGAGRGLVVRTLLAGVGGVGGLLLCAAFLIPLFAEGPHLQQQVYVTNTYDFRNHFVYWGQFFSPFWGFGYSDDPQGGSDGMSFQIGLLALLLGFAALYLLWGRPHQRGLMLYLLGSTLLLLCVMSPLSQGLWEAFPPLGVIQFPWRLLALTALMVSALAGLAVWNLQSADQSSGGGLLVGMLVLFASAGYMQANLQPVEPWREDGRAIFRFEQEHPDMIAYTEWVQEPFQSSPMTKDYVAETYTENYSDNGVLERLAIIKGTGKVISNYSRGSSFGGVVQLDTPGTVRIHVLYFPGWQARVDGALVAHRVSDPHGLVEVDLPVGHHQIDLRMGSTPARRLGALISWSVLVGVLGLFILTERRIFHFL